MKNSYPNNWNIKPLESLTLMITDGSHFSPEHQIEGFPLATVKNMKEDQIDIDSCYKISKEDYDRLVRENDKAEKNDVLFSKDGTVGQSLVFNQNDEVVLLSSIAIIRADLNVLNPYYLKYSLTSGEILNKIIGQKTGTAIKRVILRDIKRIKIPVPPLVEQRGIAEVLGTLDEAIRLTDQVIERTEALKRGLMQRLLTQGIEHKEFKDTPLGRIPKTWKIVRIKNITEVKNGSTPKRNIKEYWEKGSIPWIKTTQVNDRYITKAEEYITEKGFNNTSLIKLPKNTVLISMIGQGKNRGKSAISLIDGATTNQNFAAILPTNEFNSFFLHFYLELNYQKIRSMGRGSNQDALNCKIVESIQIPLPSIDEQNKIANLVLSFEKQISNQEKSKKKLNVLKIGLMQVLLSGSVRVELREDGLHRVGDS